MNTKSFHPTSYLDWRTKLGSSKVSIHDQLRRFSVEQLEALQDEVLGILAIEKLLEQSDTVPYSNFMYALGCIQGVLILKDRADLCRYV